MKWITANIYLQIIIAYVFLFFILMSMIKMAYPQIYQLNKCKVVLLFCGVLLIMSFRWIIYLCLQFSWIEIIQIEKPSGEIPFYVSELAISSCFIGFLTKVYDQPEQVSPPPERRKSSV